MNQSLEHPNQQDDCGWANKSSYSLKVPHLCQTNEHELKERDFRMKK